MTWKQTALAAALLMASACSSSDKGGDTAAERTAARGAASVAASDTVDKLVDVGGHRLHVRTVGHGSPAVVVCEGVGGGWSIWQGVADSIGRENRFVLYERAGYGQSDPGPMPRTADRIVIELEHLLENTPVEPPYVLVGHSLGAQYAMYYALEHFDQVVGLVVLDPPPLEFALGNQFPVLRAMVDKQTEEMQRDAVFARANGDTAQADFLRTVASEHANAFTTNAEYLAQVESLRDLPFVVVGSGVPNPAFGDSASAFQKFWRKSNESLSHLSTRGRFVFVEGSSHNLPREATARVVAAIRSVMPDTLRR